MENNNGKMPESELQAGELQKEQPTEATQLAYDPSQPSVVHIEVEGDQTFIDTRNFQSPLGAIIALQTATGALMQQIQTQVNSRPMPPRPIWARGGKA